MIGLFISPSTHFYPETIRLIACLNLIIILPSGRNNLLPCSDKNFLNEIGPHLVRINITFYIDRNGYLRS